jgi:uncharacterized protein (TIGR00730 family)
MVSMENTENLSASRLADAWAQLQAHAQNGTPLQADAYRLAFADPEFLLRRETRGMRMQLEMLKPDLEQLQLGIENTIVVFGSARFVSPEAAEQALQQARRQGDAQALAAAQRQIDHSVYYDQARQFARLVARYSRDCVAQRRLYICTGGGPGIMEAANRGAHDEGMPNVGLNIALPHEQGANPYITPSLNFKFHYFALRKMHFMMRAKALVAFPGGYGTLDELFEVLTLVQTRKAKPVPILLFGSRYWKSLLNFDALLEAGAISPEDLELFRYVDEPETAWQWIKDFYKL